MKELASKANLTPLEKFEASTNIKHSIVAENNLLDAIYHHYVNKIYDFGQTISSFDFNHLFGVPASILQAEVYPKFKEYLAKNYKTGKMDMYDSVYWFVWPDYWKFVALGSMIDFSYIPLPWLIKNLLFWIQGYMFDQGIEGQIYEFSTGVWLSFGITLSCYGLPFFDGFCDNYAYLVYTKLGTSLKVRRQISKTNF